VKFPPLSAVLLCALALLAPASPLAHAQNASTTAPADPNGPLEKTPQIDKTPQTPPALEPSTPSAPDRAAQSTAPAPSGSAKILSAPLTPLPTDAEDGRIGQVVAQILEKAHYLQRPLDDAMSQLFLKMYVDALDYRHMVFLQSDLDEFNQKYGVTLGAMTLSGDILPAREIYDRYVQRLKERQAQVEVILKTPPDFSKSETFLADRTKAPWPQSLDEANELWRLQIKYELLAGLLSKEKPEDTAKLISKRYARLVKSMDDFDHTDLLGVYLSALTHAYDPHSDYFTADDADNFKINSIDMSLVGIGAVLRTEDGYPQIVSLVPGGPADLDGRLKPKDRIVAVGQDKEKPVDVVDMKLSKVVDMIRGKSHTKVVLTVIPAEGGDVALKKDIVIVRDEVKLTEQKAKARIYEKETPAGVQRYGVIILPGFYEHSAQDCASLIQRLEKEKIQGVVLDLRRNGGGILEEAINLVSLFVPSGPVVQVKNPQGSVKPFLISGNNVVWSGPLIVMIGKSSASASEITAAALQDYGRALIIGDRTTFGKGSVQTLINLKDINWSFQGDPGQLKLTVQKFYRINGDTTQNQGVSSDIILPSIEDYLEFGESLLPNAMPADQVPAATYKRMNPPFPFVAQLQQKSNDRMAANPEFGYLNQEIALLKQREIDKTISLNQAKRQTELDDAKTLKDKLDKAVAGLPPSDHKVYVLDLDMLDKGLPPKLVTKAAKPKDDKADLTKQANPDSDDDDDSMTPSTGVERDIHLDETINIFGDFLNALGLGSAPMTAQAGSGGAN